MPTGVAEIATIVAMSNKAEPSMKSKKAPNMTTLRISLIAAAVMAALPALAQTPPDAGQILQQQAPAPQLPKTSPAIEIHKPTSTLVAPGGTQVTVQAISIGGNSVFSEAELLAVLGDVAGKSYDLAGLHGLVERISAHYRDAGYPFARAYLPQQAAADGRLRIEVVEGRYGKVQTLGDKYLADSAAGFLAPLKAGGVIDGATLERTTLILDDQPGIKITPIIRPGQELGTGDLDVRVERTPGFSGDVGFDNHGNRYTGAYRALANLRYDSPFLFGDEFTARVLASEEGQWLGALGYSAPLGSSGLRGQMGYNHTYYELGKDYSNLDATGTAKVTSAGLSYPILRSQQANLNLSGLYQYKELNDRNGLAATNDDKKSDSLALALAFDRRDTLGGGGITYGALAYTSGQLKLSPALETTDRTSGQDTRGSFDKWNLDLARVQATSIDNLSLFGRLSAQWAGKNLDSSEGYTLGGAQGVRAYPQGEGTGDEGWFVQLEARYQMGAFAPYVFHDAGSVTYNAKNAQLTASANPNTRSLAGSGLGVRYNEGKLSMDANLAWRNHGGAPTSDTRDDQPRVWVTVKYGF